MGNSSAQKLHTNLVSKREILGSMAKGTHDFKRMESMLKAVDQKREIDLSRVKSRLGVV